MWRFLCPTHPTSKAIADLLLPCSLAMQYLLHSCLLLAVRAAVLSLRDAAFSGFHPVNISDQGQCCCRERAELEQKYRDHIDSLSARNSELDSDNRQLRQHKYELDTKVSSAQLQQCNVVLYRPSETVTCLPRICSGSQTSNSVRLLKESLPERHWPPILRWVA